MAGNVGIGNIVNGLLPCPLARDHIGIPSSRITATVVDSTGLARAILNAGASPGGSQMSGGCAAGSQKEARWGRAGTMPHLTKTKLGPDFFT